MLAQKLRMLRLVRGWSQERLAAASGLHRTYVSLIERSECNVSLDTLEQIANALSITPSELLGTPDPAELGEEVLRALMPAAKRKGR